MIIQGDLVFASKFFPGVFGEGALIQHVPLVLYKRVSKGQAA